ncbi:hypothetical protein HF289_10610 [Acidithiobacillus ferrooxidans]|uniref:PriCT-2 domain-containing protein n=1 Tax=Acidithiobacillus ferrooxidans TaxID=920 RepID=UPI001C0780BF|nr:PriCT-2 domain-containing protein [Acidithiobacillus ferrooxidans]MBU2857296.1 hypothetical protein [Acidithiobacillus ferrooxidans]
MIALTLITSKTVISKGFRLRGQALEKIKSGNMYSGTAERLDVPDMAALIPVITSMNSKQALCYGTPTVPSTQQIVTKARQVDGKNIARSRKFFEFKEGQEGILLIDYDPPKNEKPLDATDVPQLLGKVCPAIATSEKLIISSASSYLYRKSDGVCMKGAGGLHILLRVQNAAEIPEMGEAINARLWIAGFGHIAKSDDGKNLVRSLIDTSVWQPERLSYDSGADCGAGLEQRRPPIQHVAGGSLSLADVDLPEDDWTRYRDLVDAAKGVKPRAAVSKDKSRGRNPAEVRKERAARPAAPLAPAKPLTPAQTARVMGALLHVPSDCDYQTWITLGMALKTGCGDAGFALWDNWSKVSASYPGAQSLRAKWASFDHGHVTIKTLYYHAKQHGWDSKAKKIDLPLPVRAALEPEPLADAVDILKARATTLQTLYQKIVKDETPDAISALRITVGVGKTSNLKSLFDDIKRKKSITIVAKDKKACESYEAAGAFRRHGREATEQGFTPETPWHCPHAGGDGPVQKLAEAEHRLQQMCRGGHCAHGNRAMLDKARDTGQPASDVVIRFFKEKPELLDVPACTWFDHLAAGQHHKIRVVTAAGISPADLKTTTGQVDFLIIDEGVEWSHSHLLDLPTIRSYIESLGTLKKTITKNDQNAPTDFLDAPVKIFRDLAIQMGTSAATADAGVYQPVSFDLSGIVEELNAALDDHGSALWEKPQWSHWTDLVKAPLRALSAIKDGLRAGSLTMKDGALHLTYLHSVIENALRGAKKVPILIMDATLDATASAIIDDDHVTHVVAEPNCEWKIDPRWFMPAKNDAESLKKEYARLSGVWQRQEVETGFQSYVICRKALALFVLSQKTGTSVDELLELPKNELWDISIEQKIGWYGWHDVAHDDWKGLNCVLWGQQPTPDGVRLQQYMDHRAALMQIMPDQPALPMADNAWSAGQWVSTGDMEQQGQARLPVQPEVRDWLLQTVSDQRIQAAGRARAVCQDRRVTIWQIGGYPMTGLAAHGIRPQYARLVDGLSGGEVAALHAEQRMERMTTAAAALVAQGGVISRRTMRKKISTMCKPLINNKSSDGELVPSRYIYIYQDGTSSRQQEVIKNKELQHTSFRDTEYTVWLSTEEAARFAGRFDPRDAHAPEVMPVSVDTDADSAARMALEAEMPLANDYEDVDEGFPDEAQQTGAAPTEFQLSVLQDGLDYLGEAAADAPEGLTQMLHYLESEQYLAASAALAAEIRDLRKNLSEAAKQEVL